MILSRRFGPAGSSDDDDGYLKRILEVVTSSGKEGKGRKMRDGCMESRQAYHLL
jgi:hypothetical protein